MQKGEVAYWNNEFGKNLKHKKSKQKYEPNLSEDETLVNDILFNGDMFLLHTKIRELRQAKTALKDTKKELKEWQKTVNDLLTYQEENKENTELIQRNDELESEWEQLNDQVQRLTHSKQERKEDLKKIKALNSQVNDLKAVNNQLKKDIGSANKKLKNTQKKESEVIDSFVKRTEENMKVSDDNYKDIFKFVYQKLDHLMTCPITMEKFDIPAVLPSGTTIEQSFMEKLINGKKHDPFDRQKPCKLNIVNRLAQEIQNLVASCDKKLSGVALQPQTDTRRPVELEPKSQDPPKISKITTKAASVQTTKEKQKDFSQLEFQNRYIVGEFSSLKKKFDGLLDENSSLRVRLSDTTYELNEARDTANFQIEISQDLDRQLRSSRGVSDVADF